MAKSAKAESLFKRLGELDKERRKVLNEISSSPEYATHFLKQALAVLLVEHKNKWYSRQNDKNQSSYFKIMSVEQVPLDKSTRLPRGTNKKLGGDLTLSKSKKVLAKIKVQWVVWGYAAVELRTETEEIDISVFKDIVPQILNGRTLATKFDEKKVIKTTLDAKKKEIEAQLAKVNSEIAALK